MSDDILPNTEPSGALVPPPRNPPTALATAAPLPPRRQEESVPERFALLRSLVHSAFDTLDSVGDRIAGAIGLR